MDAQNQIENAIDWAFDPKTEPDLKKQAYEFIHQLTNDPNSWQACLPLFTRSPPPSEVVRMYCLQIVNTAVQIQTLDQPSSVYIRDSLMAYVRQNYTPASTEVDHPSIQNKITQTITYLFTRLYANEWTSFFDDFKELAGGAESIGTSNPSGTILYLRLLSSIHDEIADVLISRQSEEHKRNTELKDLIRAKDVNKVGTAWREILSRWQEIDLSITEMCLRCIAKWVSWIDISIVVDPTVLAALLGLAGRQGDFTSTSKEARARDAAIDTFTETVGKKMGAKDKIEVIEYLNLSTIVGQLIASPALAESRRTPKYDTDLAETVAKLVNNVVFDIVKVLETDNVDAMTVRTTNGLLEAFVPYLLRFFSDEYDEICSAVIPSLTDLLTMIRRNVRSQVAPASEYSAMLQPMLDAVVAKMKYDETANWGAEDESTDEAEFQELRKRLHVLQQTIASIDEDLYIRTLSRVIVEILTRLDSADNKPSWRDLDLAMHELYLFGELTVRNQGLYAKSAPSSTASQQLLEMMAKMVDTGLASFQHPAIQLHYMEICVRYVQFFEHNPAVIPRVLENFVGFVHSEHPKVRLRSWYLFQKFGRHLRGQLGNFAETITQAIGDLLTIQAELPEEKDCDDLSSEDVSNSADAAFSSQLYLFELIGLVSSTTGVPPATQVAISKSVIDPLSSDLHQRLGTARNGDARDVLQVHHIIMALGTLANGFADSPTGSFGKVHSKEVSDAFLPASEAVLLALETLKSSSDIRLAARHAFSRLLGARGSDILPQLPRWIDGLLSPSSAPSEMAMFLRTLGQVVYGFQTKISEYLDQLFTPLLERIFTGLSQPITGTDDEVQLKELKQQYLNFVLVILNNDLAPVLVSPANQGTFEAIVDSFRRFGCDAADPQSARLAISALMRMTIVWGGPDISADSSAAASPSLPGFDNFILTQIAPMPWALLSSPGFVAGDAQMRSVLQEVAALQWTILRKTGRAYIDQLQNDLRNLGAHDDSIRMYVETIKGDQPGFRKFFAAFVLQGK